MPDGFWYALLLAAAEKNEVLCHRNLPRPGTTLCYVRCLVSQLTSSLAALRPAQALSASPLQDPEACASDFINGCLGAATPASCDTCVGAITDCTATEKTALDLTCKGAPFPPAAGCATEVLKDCAASLNSSATCTSCVLKSTFDLKKHNCSVADIGAAAAICKEIPQAPAPLSARLSTPQECAESFIEDCLASATPDACSACVSGESDCGAAEQAALALACKEAPFPPAAGCASEILKDCAASLNSSAACDACVLKSTFDLKKHNCSVTDVAAAAAVCKEIPGQL